MSVNEAKNNLRTQLDSQALADQVTVSRAELEKLLDWADSATRTICEFIDWANSCPGNEKPPAVVSAEGGSGVDTLWIPDSATVDALVSALGPSEFPTIDLDMTETVKSSEDGFLYPLAVDRVVQEGCSGSRVPRVETDRRSRGNEKGGRVSVAVFDVQSRDTVLLESINNFLLDIRQFLVGNIDGGPVVANMSHEVSLSVDDAPDGAGVGTSESTERVHTPTSSETEMPSAVAAAEGGETNNPER